MNLTPSDTFLKQIIYMKADTKAKSIVESLCIIKVALFLSVFTLYYTKLFCFMQYIFWNHVLFMFYWLWVYLKRSLVFSLSLFTCVFIWDLWRRGGLVRSVYHIEQRKKTGTNMHYWTSAEKWRKWAELEGAAILIEGFDLILPFMMWSYEIFIVIKHKELEVLNVWLLFLIDQDIVDYGEVGSSKCIIMNAFF